VATVRPSDALQLAKVAIKHFDRKTVHEEGAADILPALTDTTPSVKVVVPLYRHVQVRVLSQATSGLFEGRQLAVKAMYWLD
jgi:hypothetical protein